MNHDKLKPICCPYCHSSDLKFAKPSYAEEKLGRLPYQKLVSCYNCEGEFLLYHWKVYKEGKE